MIKKNLGGERLGSGNKMQVSMKGYGKSTFNLSKIRRTSMTVGTLVPMGHWLALPGDRFEIDLDALITTAGTESVLYGSMKFQVDVFSQRISSFMPNMTLNLVEQGLNIKDIKIPQVVMEADPYDWTTDPSNQHTNPSCIWAYLGIRGLGQTPNGENPKRKFNALPYLMYHAIGKEFYANKQEKIGAVIHTNEDDITLIGDMLFSNNFVTNVEIPHIVPVTGAENYLKDSVLQITSANSEVPNTAKLKLLILQGWTNVMDIYENVEIRGTTVYLSKVKDKLGSQRVTAWSYTSSTDEVPEMPRIVTFPLKNVDLMAMDIMKTVGSTTPFEITAGTRAPYGLTLGQGASGTWAKMVSQEGLLLKTYQSDVFNNYLDTIWINQINTQSRVSTTGDSFTIDSLLINQKVYNYLNRIAAGGGTLDDWREVTYDHRSYTKTNKPVYEGGLSKEIVFDPVTATAATEDTPLGTIATRGTFGSKHKGGKVTVRVDEESYIMVIASITPRISYSQGNRWDVNLKTLDDLHKPEFDKIGYQDLILETAAHWDTLVNPQYGPLSQRAIGKQPSWQWYKTDYDDNLGNFASTERYKVLDRQYGWTPSGNVQDVTTYIDPTKYNDVFAYKAADAQNFDVQVGMEVTARRVMSAEVVQSI